MRKVRIGLPLITIFEADKITDNLSSLSINNMVFEPLLKWKRRTPHPALISAWSCSDDCRRWEFTIRDNAIFHDGKACTPDDVFYMFEQLSRGQIGHNMQSPYNTYLQWWKWHKSAPNRFVMESEFPSADILDLFCDIYIKRCDQYGEWLGTGPYQITEREEHKITLTAVMADAVYQTAEIFAIANAEDRHWALENGDVDIATELPMELNREKPIERYELQKTVQTLSVIGFLNGFGVPFNQPDARLAVNLAVNKTAIIQEVLHGCGIPASTIVSPSHFGYMDEISPIGYEPEKAQRMIGKCGISEPLVIKTPLVKPERAEKIAALIAHDLRNIGLDVTVVTEPDRTKYAQEIGAKRSEHIAIFDSSPYSTFRVMYEKIDSDVKWQWWQGIQDDKLPTLFFEARRSANMEVRRGFYGKCLKHLNRNPHWLYLYHPVLLSGFRSSSDRIGVNPYGILELGMRTE